MTLAASIGQVSRRLNWLRPRSFGAAVNLAAAGLRFTAHDRRAAKLPPMVKIDISPVCSLGCPACLHADPAGRNKPLLDRQIFNAAQRMDVGAYARIIEELRHTSIAVSLYYYGDPLAHPRFTEFARIAADAGLQTHASTHLSHNLSDEKIAAIVASGLSHLTVDVDGATQETYGVTRVRGRLDRVIGNLERLVAEKRKQRNKALHIEVQHLRFPHHGPGEARQVEALAKAVGADSFSTFDGAYLDIDGDLYNAVDTDLGVQEAGEARSRKLLPLCHWPYTGTVIKSTATSFPAANGARGSSTAAGATRVPSETSSKPRLKRSGEALRTRLFVRP